MYRARGRAGLDWRVGHGAHCITGTRKAAERQMLAKLKAESNSRSAAPCAAWNDRNGFGHHIHRGHRLQVFWWGRSSAFTAKLNRLVDCGWTLELLLSGTAHNTSPAATISSTKRHSFISFPASPSKTCGVCGRSAWTKKNHLFFVTVLSGHDAQPVPMNISD